MEREIIQSSRVVSSEAVAPRGRAKGALKLFRVALLPAPLPARRWQHMSGDAPDPRAHVGRGARPTGIKVRPRP
jgi:hypothetical protein